MQNQQLNVLKAWALNVGVITEETGQDVAISEKLKPMIHEAYNIEISYAKNQWTYPGDDAVESQSLCR